MKTYEAMTPIEGQLVLMIFHAEGPKAAWDFAVKYLYPPGSRSRMEVRELRTGMGGQNSFPAADASGRGWADCSSE